MKLVLYSLMGATDLEFPLSLLTILKNLCGWGIKGYYKSRRFVLIDYAFFYFYHFLVYNLSNYVASMISNKKIFVEVIWLSKEINEVTFRIFIKNALTKNNAS